MQYQERWERKIREFMDTYGIAGLAVAVSDREKILWHNAYGVTALKSLGIKSRRRHCSVLRPARRLRLVSW